MNCSHCGVCCKKTEMMLSEIDMLRLENEGYSRVSFVRYDRHGYAFLRNRRGHCVFYDSKRHRCSVYRYRPLGCHTYPVICSEENAVIIDFLCPMGHTVTKKELRRKGNIVKKLLERIELEAKGRR